MNIEYDTGKVYKESDRFKMGGTDPFHKYDNFNNRLPCFGQFNELYLPTHKFNGNNLNFNAGNVYRWLHNDNYVLFVSNDDHNGSFAPYYFVKAPNEYDALLGCYLFIESQLLTDYKERNDKQLGSNKAKKIANFIDSCSALQKNQYFKYGTQKNNQTLVCVRKL